MISFNAIKSRFSKEIKIYKNYEKEAKVIISLNEYAKASSVAESFHSIARLFSAQRSTIIGIHFVARIFIITTSWKKESKNLLPMKEIIEKDWKYLSLQVLSVVSLFFRFGFLYSIACDVMTFLLSVKEDKEKRSEIKQCPNF